MTEKGKPEAGLSFVMSEDGEKLLAVFEPAATVMHIDLERLNRMLVGHGFADLFIYADALDQLVKKMETGSAFTQVVGERRDGAFYIKIDSDLMGARLTMTPACGGKPVTVDQIDRGLLEMGVKYGILDETIRSCIDKGYARNKLIAEGDRPVKGEDARFLSLVREISNSSRHFDDEEIIDYRSFGNIITVKQGDPLMRRVPPTEGRQGTNILGETVSAPAGDNIRFSTPASGVAVHPDDPDLLVAAISGQPVLLPNGVNVEPVITMKNIDLSTGNLDIEGTLNITGDVKPGMHVKATADIVIEGMVEAGHIEAGGDVDVKGAVIGQGEPRNGAGELNPLAAVILANGSVKALFVENAFISSGADIVVGEFVMKSELSAGSRILVGEPGSSKGRIISSLCRASAGIEAVTIGSRSGAGTVLEVGTDPQVRDRFISAKQMLHCKERELDEVSKALAYFRDNADRTTPEAIKEKENALRGLQTEIQELTGQLRRLKKRSELIDCAAIRAVRQVYCGVRVRIGEKSLLLDRDLDGVTFTQGENGITF